MMGFGFSLLYYLSYWCFFNCFNLFSFDRVNLFFLFGMIFIFLIIFFNESVINFILEELIYVFYFCFCWFRGECLNL